MLDIKSNREPQEHSAAFTVERNRGEASTATYIEALLKENRFDEIGHGKTAKVILLRTRHEDADPWIIKQRNRDLKNQIGVDFENEFLLQDAAFQIIRDAQRRDPEKKFAGIPKPLSLFHDEKNEWLIMEYLAGETLFERALRVFIARYTYADSRWSNILPTARKDELIAILTDEEIINTLPARYVEEIKNGGEIDEQYFIGIALEANKYTEGGSKILTMEQYVAIKNTLEELHKHGIHHRDLHPSNIQLLPDGSIHILDFGLAKKIPLAARQESTPIYTETISEGSDAVLRTLPDLSMLETFHRIARKIK